MASSNDRLQTNINVVLLGETGTGKSTLINYLTNLFYNGSINNLKIATPTRYFESNMSSIFSKNHEKYLDDVTRCKTNECTKYSFHIKQVHFNFFDTPGINVSGGYLEDNANLEKIFHCVQSLDCIHGLFLILNGTQARLTVNIKTIFERFRDRIPTAFYSNIILILTHCSSHTVNFESIEYLHNAPIFYMQNSIFSSDPQTWTDQTRQILQRDWNRSIETMNDLIKTLVLLTPISTESLGKLNYHRDIIRSILHESRLMIMELQYIEDELAALEQAAQIYSENLTQTKTIQVNEITPTSYHNTICLKCNIVCHERCSLNETEQIGTDIFRHCEIMNNGRCTICPDRCSAEMHYHDRRLIKCVSRKIKFAISSLSKQMLDVKEDKIACEIKCKTVQEAKDLIEQLLQEQFDKIEDTCRNIRQTCQNFNILEELYTCISLLKNELKALRSRSVIDKARKFIEQLEILADNCTNQSSTIKKTKRRKRNQRQKIFTNQDDDFLSLSTSRLFTDHTSNRISSMENQYTNHLEIIDSLSDQNYSEYPTEHLIELIRQSMIENTLILEELNRRCHQTSIGDLTTTQILILCEYYASVRCSKPDELLRLHAKLQSESPSISIDKLLYLTAIKLCLQNIDQYQ